MNENMKILIGCDGSEFTVKVLADLKRAGLPEQAEVMVLTAAENWLAPPTSFGGVEVLYSEESDEINKAAAILQQMKALLGFSFPEWKIQTDAVWGMAAAEIIERADTWMPDLIVVGSHGKSALSRFFMGSVAQSILHHVHCSVHIARGKIKEQNAPVKILIGMDGSKNASAAVDVVAERRWPAGSQVRLVNATWHIPPSAHRPLGPIAEWLQAENVRIRLAIRTATTQLSTVGLSVSSLVEQEEPQKLLCNEAESWDADCIFMGARGLGELDRLMLGSVSSAVAAKAVCPVEIVRLPKL